MMLIPWRNLERFAGAPGQHKVAQIHR
jgi:hypothetical protein